MADLVSRLLHRASWQVEKMFKARGWLSTMVWCTESEDGRREMFETACEAERTEISDNEALAALCAELRADFAAEGVVRYGVAFPATATKTVWPSALHRDAELRKHDVVAIEAHDAAVHLRAHREIVFVSGAPRLAALGPVEPVAVTCFGML